MSVFESIFANHEMLAEIMFPVPYVNTSEYGSGDLVVYIGKAGTGLLGYEFAPDTWFGEVRYFQNGMGGEFEILHSGEFHINHDADHIRATYEYVKQLIGVTEEGKPLGHAWLYRLDVWASAAFARNYEREEVVREREADEARAAHDAMVAHWFTPANPFDESMW